jgi:hypothetical protein
MIPLATGQTTGATRSDKANSPADYLPTCLPLAPALSSANPQQTPKLPGQPRR